MFLVIQMILGTNFIKQVTGNSVQIGVRRFPDKGHEFFSIANALFPLMTTFSFVFIMPAMLKRVGEEKTKWYKEYQRPNPGVPRPDRDWGTDAPAYTHFLFLA
ncbi:uncharacterized protein LOC124373319 [Homalodisca vitripennis]|uniref:uncharacterized protein LOC124373319 n=1 Tax=Homalodisca vitripennis TaxID=197043 RepID=UPI001EEC8168|nr:uncharacterized protein LOC124373319 [Homalodisca vitripennis]